MRTSTLAACALVVCFGISSPRPAAAKPSVPRQKVTVPSINAALLELAPAEPAGTFRDWLDSLPAFCFSPPTARLLVRDFGTDRLFSVEKNALANGSTDYALLVPARQSRRKGGDLYAWSPMQAHFTVSGSDGTVVSDVSAPRLRFENKKERMLLENATFSSTGRRGDSGLFNGNFSAAIGKTTMTLPAGRKPVTIENVYLKGSAGEEPTTLNMRFEAGSGTLRLADLQVDELRLAAHIDNMDKQAVQTFRLLTAALTSQSTLSMAERAAATEPLWRDLVSALASKGAVVELEDFHIGYKGSTARMRGYYRFDHMTPQDFNDPEMVQKKMVSHVEASVPLAMAAAIVKVLGGPYPATLPRGANDAAIAQFNRDFFSQFLQGPIAAGMVRIDGDALVTTFDMHDGVVLLNGKPITPPVPDDEPVAAVDSRAGSRHRAYLAQASLVEETMDGAVSDQIDG